MIARELDRVLRQLLPRRPAAVQRARRRRPSSPTSTRAMRAPAGSTSASATSPTPRIRRSAPTCWPRGWTKVYHPGAGVLHAHDYGAARIHAPLLRRVPRAARDHRPRRAPAPARRRSDAGGRGPALDERPGARAAAQRAGWAARSIVHHGGRRTRRAGRLARRSACPRRALARGPRRGPRQPSRRASGARPGRRAGNAASRRGAGARRTTWRRRSCERGGHAAA